MKGREPIVYGVISAEEAAERFSPIFKGRAGRLLFNAAAALTGIDNINRTHDRLCKAGVPFGPDFAEAILKDIDVEFLIGGAEHLAEMVSGPFITVSNHIYGHLDGICLLDLIGHVRPCAKVMVNDLLTLIKGLAPNFIAVNPTLKDKNVTAANVNGVRQCLAQLRSGEPLCLFPSGAVADLRPREHWTITERDWQDEAVKIIRKAKVPVFPIRFFDRNSDFYYGLGLIDYRVRFVRLFHEMYNKRGATPRMAIGAPISVEEQEKFGDLQSYKEFLRNSVYGMTLPETLTRRTELVLPSPSPLAAQD